MIVLQFFCCKESLIYPYSTISTTILLQYLLFLLSKKTENTNHPHFINKSNRTLIVLWGIFALFLKEMYKNEKTSVTLILLSLRYQFLFFCPMSEPHPRRTGGYEPRFQRFPQHFFLCR